METNTQSFPIQFASLADNDAIVLGPCVRFSILTSRLLRMEYSPTSNFEDRPSQAFWYRKHPVPKYVVRHSDSLIEIETEHLLLSYLPSEHGFSAESLTIFLKESEEYWRYGQADPLNLLGTARTLDNVDGVVELGQGLVSRQGWSVWDDSEQLLFNHNGWMVPRVGEKGYEDLYYFGFGHDYYGCLQDFCRVTGPAPMIPRWALGNWWSRYWAYSADELLGLMDEFSTRGIPISVCIVDMDWHIVDTGNSCSGWTGYTWNRNLFPDPPAFIQALHDRGLKTALNLHPAEGIHDHEAQYEQMAKALGIDPKSKQPIPFEIDDPQFTKAYFELLHHPYEEQGVDFWWIDWQQGTLSGLPGLDPLWWLNHLHFHDLARTGDRMPFVFSRWGGLGNHRYPIGFSGDTLISWDSLAFQPYFTATAANVNYGWWSHDIGGHMSGIEDAELFARWVQFGVFSPILRLHSTKNPFHERRPWGYDAETERVSADAMRLRHRLIPYLQSMSWHNYSNSVPLVRPMYYENPEDEQAYHCRDQYLFGTELLVAPFTSPADQDTRLSRQVVWLPSDGWFDFFSGEKVAGDCWHALYGGLDDIPVFAKAGAIVPVSSSQAENDKIELHLFPGAAGKFELFTGEGPDSGCITLISHSCEEQQWKVQVEVARILGSFTAEPHCFDVCFRGMDYTDEISAEIDGKRIPVNPHHDSESNSLKLGPISLDPQSKLVLAVQHSAASVRSEDPRLLRIGRKMVKAFRMNTNTKLDLSERLPYLCKSPSYLTRYQFALTASQMRALAEILIGAGFHRANAYETAHEEIVLWNNNSSYDARWVFAADNTGGLAYQESNIIPKFGLLATNKNGISFHTASQPRYRKLSVEQWFNSIVKQIPSDQISDIDAIIQFNIQGDISYQKFLTLVGGEAILDDGSHPEPSITIKASEEAWLRLINGELSPEQGFVSGALQVGGDFQLMSGLVGALGLSPAGTYFGHHWRCEIDYFDALKMSLGNFL